MLSFKINKQKCTSCGQCVSDCPAQIIAMEQGHFPFISPALEESCYRCQHCLAVCPTGAVSILGVKPENSLLITDILPGPDQMETLIKGRRSVRHYKDENLDPAQIQHLLEVAWHAPSGINTRKVRFTVVDDKDKLALLRNEIMAGLAKLVRDNALPEAWSYFADFVTLWEEKGIDTLFRGAPHLLIASAPKDTPTPVPDCLIALSYFELYAQSCGIGTVWDGLAKVAINDLLPETRQRLDIPDDHIIGYAMAFGKPAVSYTRTVQHGPAIIHRI
jgi:nitroreductase/NAD-dependent dihydropyrimidine dehydrogenase PreA subunit